MALFKALTNTKKSMVDRALWRPDCNVPPCGLPGPRNRFRPLQKICSGSPRQYPGPNTCASNRSRLCSTIKTATSANVARQSCSVFRSPISAGSPDAPAWDKFNPNQTAHSSFSRMTNSRSSPLFRPPRPTNSSICQDRIGQETQRLGRDDEIFVAGVCLSTARTLSRFPIRRRRSNCPKFWSRRAELNSHSR